MPIATSGGALVTGANIVDGSIGPLDLNDDAVADKFPASSSEILRPVWDVTHSRDNNGHSSNTTMAVSLMEINAKITVSQISLDIQAVTVAGKLKIAIYSNDGQTKHIEVETGTISSTGLLNISCTPTRLLPGTYYVAVLPVSTANIGTWGYQPTTNNTQELLSQSVTGKQILNGTLTVTASTIPSTIDPTAITGAWSSRVPVIRLSA